jgi:uncharacterized protein YjiS (DUF1127 family)
MIAVQGLASPSSARGARHEIPRRLGAHLIDDIGLGPEEAAEEAGKPFWRA